MQLSDCHISIRFSQRRRMLINFNCDVVTFTQTSDVIAIKIKKRIRFVNVIVKFSVIIKSFDSAIFTAISISTFRFFF